VIIKKISLENDLMETKGTFKLSLRNVITLLGFFATMSAMFYGQQASISSQGERIEKIAIMQDARMEAIKVAQEVIKTDVGAIKTQMSFINLQQQKFEIDIAVMKLQLKQLESAP